MRSLEDTDAVGTRGPQTAGTTHWFDPLSPEVRALPYPSYRRLREEEPVCEFRPGMWALTRFDDCVAVLRDARRFSADASNSTLYRAWRPGPRGGKGLGTKVGAGGSLIMMDPPDHTRLRGLVQKAFTTRVVERMRPRIHENVERLLDRLAKKGEGDLVQEFAYPLPLWTVCELLGIPSQDWEQFQRWSDDLVPTLDGNITPHLARKAHAATREFRSYLVQRVEERVAEPQDDLISGLLAAELDGSKLSRGELIGLAMLLVIAGHETTVNLISDGILDLLTHPAQLDLFMEADETLLRTAVDEFLRYDAPVQQTARAVLEDLEIRGKQIRQGQQVVVVIGAANRDPEQFPDPDRFDITRMDNRHLTFSGGIHRCVGASLGHTEAQIAVSSLFRRFPKLRLATERIEWRDTRTFRGPKQLPVKLA